MRYDPDVGPDPQKWLALPEDERVVAVRQQHKRAGNKSGNPHLHAAIHAVVETQLAEGHASASAALTRLLSEGLDRDEAIHAIGSVVATEMFQVLKSQRPHDPAVYARKLDKLTAQEWRSGSREE